LKPQTQITTNPLFTGALLALLATIIWSGNFIVSRGLGQMIHPATLAFLRWSTALIILLPFAMGPTWKQRHLVKKHFRYLALTSFLGITVFNTLIYTAGRTTGALNMALISTSIPVFIILFARLFQSEAITMRKLAGMCAAVAGVLLIITRGDFRMLTALTFAAGDFWMLLAAALFAAYSILVRNKPKELGQATFLTASFGIGLGMLIPWSMGELMLYGAPDLTPTILGAVLYIGLGASLLAYMCWNGAISRIGPAKAGMVYYSLPLFSGLEAWLLLGEPVGWFHLLGGVSIVGGIYAATRVTKLQPPK